jgi:hypothetical protein
MTAGSAPIGTATGDATSIAARVKRRALSGVRPSIERAASIDANSFGMRLPKDAVVLALQPLLNAQLQFFLSVSAGSGHIATKLSNAKPRVAMQDM